MCGRYADARSAQKLADAFAIGRISEPAAQWAGGWNISPMAQIPIVLESTSDDGVERRLELARWSLTPPWSKTLATKFTTFNARSETAADKPMFRTSVKTRRAIIPATGYYEWQTIDGTKHPNFIHLPGDEDLALAGLYSWWPDPQVPEDDESRWHLTVTMLTSDAIETLGHIHDREPVPLPRVWWDRWLDPEVEGDAHLVHDAVDAALDVAQHLVHHEVAPLRGDGPQLVEPVA